MNCSEIKNLFFIVQIWILRLKKKHFLQFLVDILPLGFGSVDLHILRIRIWIQEAIILWIQRIRIRIRIR